MRNEARPLNCNATPVSTRGGRAGWRASGYDLAVRVTATTRIACPPENVFDVLADLRNDKQWNSRVSRA